MQKYVSQPSDNLNGGFDVARWNEVKEEYEVIEPGYPSEEDSKARATYLNQDDYEWEHQNDLIDKYHDYAHSSDSQKRNSAKEFFSRFPYQREVCEGILKECYK